MVLHISYLLFVRNRQNLSDALTGHIDVSQQLSYMNGKDLAEDEDELPVKLILNQM